MSRENLQKIGKNYMSWKNQWMKIHEIFLEKWRKIAWAEKNSADRENFLIFCCPWNYFKKIRNSRKFVKNSICCEMFHLLRKFEKNCMKWEKFHRPYEFMTILIVHKNLSKIPGATKIQWAAKICVIFRLYRKFM